MISIKFIAECVEKLGLNSYEEISRDLLGEKLEEVCRYMLIFYLFGACVGYIVLVGELLDPLAPHVLALFPFVAEAHVRQFSMTLFWSVTMLPLSLTRNLDRLAYSSLLAIVAAGYLSLFIIYRYAFPFEEGKLGPVHMNHPARHTTFSPACRTVVPAFVKTDFLMLLSLPIMMYSVDCQTLIFQLYHSIRNPSHQKLTRVGAYAILLACTFYFLIGMFGYLSFGDCVKGNILMNFNPRVDTGAAVAYVLYCTPVVMAYAISLFPCRDAIFQWQFKITPGSQAKVPTRPFYGITAALSFSCLVVAVFVPGILTVTSLLGGSISSTLCFTFPALYAWRLDAMGVIPAGIGRKIVIYAMLLLGVGGGLFGTAVAIFKTYTGYD